MKTIWILGIDWSEEYEGTETFEVSVTNNPNIANLWANLKPQSYDFSYVEFTATKMTLNQKIDKDRMPLGISAGNLALINEINTLLEKEQQQ
jgi:hypothetical protein